MEWNAPANVIGDIVGYDVNFVVPGAPDVSSSTGSRELFHLVPAGMFGSNGSRVMVQVGCVCLHMQIYYYRYLNN